MSAFVALSVRPRGSLRHVRWLLVLLAVTSSSSCKRLHALPGETPAEVCAVNNDGKVVSVAGFLVQPYFSIECEKDCSLWLAASADEEAGVFAHFSAGRGANQVRPIAGKGSLTGAGAQRLHDSDFRLLDASGQVTLHIGDTVRATGQLKVTNQNGQRVCTLEVVRVEALE